MALWREPVVNYAWWVVRFRGTLSDKAVKKNTSIDESWVISRISTLTVSDGALSPLSQWKARRHSFRRELQSFEFQLIDSHLRPISFRRAGIS